jgi:hypothetical protein
MKGTWGKPLTLLMVSSALIAAVVSVRSIPVGAQGAAPDVWRSLVADYQDSSPSGISLVGRYWRGEDGSIRLETGRSLDRLDVIHIQNVALREVYEFKTDFGWSSRPLSPGVSLVPMQQIALEGSTVATTTFEGRTALRRTGANGVIDVYVPELNFLLVDRTGPDGRRQVLRNIHVNARIASTLFAPPAGSHIGRLIESPGIQRIIPGSEIPDLPR